MGRAPDVFCRSPALCRCEFPTSRSEGNSVRLQIFAQTRLDSGRCGRPSLKSIRLNAALSVVVAVLFFSGCTGIQTPDERQARERVQAVSGNYRPGGHKPALPILTTNSGLGDFLTSALLNQRKVEAAYFDWVASVERIT